MLVSTIRFRAAMSSRSKRVPPGTPGWVKYWRPAMPGAARSFFRLAEEEEDDDWSCCWWCWWWMIWLASSGVGLGEWSCRRCVVMDRQARVLLPVPLVLSRMVPVCQGWVQGQEDE